MSTLYTDYTNIASARKFGSLVLMWISDCFAKLYKAHHRSYWEWK